MPKKNNFIHELEEILISNKKLFDFWSKNIFTVDECSYLTGLLERHRVDASDFLRVISARHINIPQLKSAIDGSIMKIHVMDENPPWKDIAINNNIIPSMITQEECRYYKWLGQFYSGLGSVVELGPWLGASTRSILSGLIENPNFEGKKLQIYDDFIWRSSWMDAYVGECDRLQNHSNFQHMFEKNMQDFLGCVKINQARFAIYDGNESVEPLDWNDGERIELLFVDCGRTVEANQGWFDKLSPYLIPKKSLIVLQDWRLHRELPAQWYNQLNLFTDRYASNLTLVHELSDGGTATFVYLG